MSTKIREKFVERMNLYGLTRATQKSYITGVKGLADFYSQSPDTLTDDQVKNYFRHLLTERKLEWSSCKTYLSGILYFYRHIFNENDNQSVPLDRMNLRLL